MRVLLGSVSIRVVWDIESKNDVRFTHAFLQVREGVLILQCMSTFFLSPFRVGHLLKLSKDQVLDNGIIAHLILEAL